MPPSQHGMPFKRKVIAKAFFGLDLPDEPSTASKTPKPRDRNRRIASKPPATDKAKGNNKITLLTLPVEIRLQIYDLLLVSRFDRTECPSMAVEHTDQKVILLEMCQSWPYRTMETEILQTCKQIYHEAIPMLYSQNVFSISEPEQMSELIAQIGLVNFKLVKTLDIWVSWDAELSPCLQLLHILAEEASGLRYITIGWGAYESPPWQLGSGTGGRGLGDNVDFVRALGKIQGLEELVLAGWYAKNWPAYLEERMGVRVRATWGYYPKKLQLKEGDLNDEELRMENLWIRESDEAELQTFREYQQGTEDLIP